MAIKKEIETNLGIIAEYWTIHYQAVIGNSLKIVLAGYVNEEKYREGKEAIERIEINKEADKSKPINWGDLYALVKEDERFKDAEDII